MNERFALGIDIGGTFTDVVVAGRDGARSVVKRLTTPDDPARAAIDGALAALGAARVAPAALDRVVHGTTLATNLILEGGGVQVGFVTTRGFRSVVPLGRHARVEEERFDLRFEPARSPVDPALIFEVDERIGPRGEIVRPLDEAQVQAVAGAISASEAQSVAVCLLHSYANADHERRVGDILRRALDVGVVLSVDVWPEMREYERSTTTIMSAYVGPVMASYVTTLEARLREIGIRAPLYIMESAGGVMTAGQVRERAVATIESGPAAGVMAALVAGRDRGIDNVIAFDMGGTTAKAGLITKGKPDVTNLFQVGGRGSFGTRRSGTGVPIKIPTIDLAEVGAGGGSIAWIDGQGSLHVGPQSAGADPGPACYGRGGEAPTVTDASVVLGYLDPTGFAGAIGGFDASLSHRAVFRFLAEPLGVSVQRAAAAVHEVVNATMAGAIHVVTVQRGIDPRRYALVVSGGAGPLHAARIAERFDIARVIVPPACGVASSLGLLTSALRSERIASVSFDEDAIGAEVLSEHFAPLERLACSDVTAADGAIVPVRVERCVDVRVRGQAHQLTVELDSPLDAPAAAAVRSRFVEQYAKSFGVRADGPIEVVGLRVRAMAPVPEVALRRPVEDLAVAARPARVRSVWFGGEPTEIAVHDLAAMPRQAAGPILIETPEATVLVPAGWAADVDRAGAVVLARRGVQ